MPLSHPSDPEHLPALDARYVHGRPSAGLSSLNPPPRILLLYGSLRDRSYSRLCIEEAAPPPATVRVRNPHLRSVCAAATRSGGGR